MTIAGLRHRRGHTRGVTLVELMVGLAVGLFVSLIAIAVFVSTRTLNVVNSSGSRMGENSRLAMDLLQDDLRNAGFQGCHDMVSEPPVSVLDSAAAQTVGFLDAPGSGLAAHRGTGTAFLPELPPALAAVSPAPDPTSDVLSVRVPADRMAYGLTATMTDNSAAPQVGAGVAGSTLRQGDIVLVASCKAGTIFQITEPDPAATGNLAHALAGPGISPGNASSDLMQRYRSDAAVYRLQTRHYYVAPSALHPGTRSLWRLTVPSPVGADNPQEMAEGIDRLNLTWGLDTDGDQTVNRYVAADAIDGRWDQVVSARLQMLSATTKDGVAQAPQTIDFAGSTFTAGDRRLRSVLTEVVTLRSRAP